MYYGNIIYCDVANGPGVRTAFFVSGCRHHCKGCFNECTWDFKYGEEYTQWVEDTLVKSLASPFMSGITILGGEPMEPENQPEILKLLRRIKKEVPLPFSNVWLYTGCTLESLFKKNSKYYVEGVTDAFFKEKLIDVLVDGPFMLDKKDISLAFRGSSNQRIIDIPKTVDEHKICLIKKYMEK